MTAMAVKNAEEALARHLANASSQKRLLGELAVALGLPQPPERIEIYDNSHIQGKHAVGGMVVVSLRGRKAAKRDVLGHGRAAPLPAPRLRRARLRWSGWRGGRCRLTDADRVVRPHEDRRDLHEGRKMFGPIAKNVALRGDSYYRGMA